MARGKKSEENKEKNRKRSKADESKPNTDAAATEAEEKPDVAKAGFKGKVKTKSKSKNLLYWEEPENMEIIKAWKRRGCTNKEIAENLLEIRESTLYEWMKLSSELSESIKKEKSRADAAVENALFAAALSGNVTAMIYYLKTRLPQYWTEKIEHKIEADVEHTGGLAYIAPRLEAEDG